jgi:hypothetical protein
VSSVQIRAAIEVLSAAGFSLVGPSVDRVRLLSVHEVSELLRVSTGKARDVIQELPHSVALPGGDFRARLTDLEAWLDAHPLTPRR